MTFAELMTVARAKSDWALLQQGKNPFLTREQKLKDIEYLRGLTNGKE